MRKFDIKKYDYSDGGSRFFSAKESQKFPCKETKFEEDLKVLSDINILNSYIEFDQMVIFIDKKDNIKTLNLLKQNGYTMLSELSGIDFLEEKGGIEVFYQLLNLEEAKRVRVKCLVKDKEFLQSVVSLYKSANWAERELYDMFGVWIENHPNLKRILMPDDWYGHPLLKSYPLEGDERAKWYEIDKIFGKERRNEFEPENRDPAFVNSKDTFNFAKIYHETQKGGVLPDSPYLQEYQEDGGVSFVKKVKRTKFSLIKKRK